MTSQRTITDIAASKLLAQHGVAVIWELHLAATAAYRAGKVAVAASLADIAEAAEREWMRAACAKPVQWAGEKGL